MGPDSRLPRDFAAEGSDFRMGFLAVNFFFGATFFLLGAFLTTFLATVLATFFFDATFFLLGGFLATFLATFFFDATFFLAGAFLATFFLEATFFFAVFFLATGFFATFFLLAFLAAVFFFVTFFFTAFFLLTGFFLLADFFADKGFFFATLRFLAADFFGVDFLATTFFRDVVAFFRFLLAAFFAGIFGLLPDQKRPGLYMAGASMEAYFLTDFYVIYGIGGPARKLAAFDNAQTIIVDDLRYENEDRAIRRRPRVTGC